MEAGCIVEKGTHNSLLAQGNIYAMLIRRQTGNAVDTASPRHDDDEPSAAPQAQVITLLTTDWLLPVGHCDRPVIAFEQT